MLKEIISPQRIFFDLEPQPKAELLKTLAQKLAELGEVQEPDLLTKNLIRRETMITTGVKEGFAFPHVFSPQVTNLSLTVARIREGTDFESLDGKPVEFIFLLIGPEARQDVHLRLLARLSRVARAPGMLENFRQASSAEEIIELITNSDYQLAGAS